MKTSTDDARTEYSENAFFGLGLGLCRSYTFVSGAIINTRLDDL